MKTLTIRGQAPLKQLENGNWFGTLISSFDSAPHFLNRESLRKSIEELKPVFTGSVQYPGMPFKGNKNGFLVKGLSLEEITGGSNLNGEFEVFKNHEGIILSQFLDSGVEFYTSISLTVDDSVVISIDEIDFVC